MQKWMVLLCAPIMLTGCAFLWRGSTAPVEFTSEPPGALVNVSNQPIRNQSVCVTPCVLKVKRTRSPTSYGAALGGHEPFNGEMLPDEEEGGPWLLVAFVDGLLLLPGIIDLASATFQNPPEKIHLVMPPSGEGAARAIVTR